MRKRRFFPKKKENLVFQSQMDESNFLEEIKTWEHPPWYGIVQIEEKVMLIFLENQRSLPQPQDSFPDAGEAINDFWSMSGNFKNRHHVEPRVQLYSPREESFPIPLKYIDVSRTTHTNLDVMQERRIDDYWNIDGSRDLSGSWTGFTQFTLLEENLQTDKCGPGGDWRQNSWHPGQITCGQNSGRKWERMPSWRRGKSGHLKNLNSIMHENYEEFISLTLRIRNSRKPSRMLVRIWKHQLLLLCPAKLWRAIRIVGVVHPTKLKQDLRVFWKPVNPQDCRWENHC